MPGQCYVCIPNEGTMIHSLDAFLMFLVGREECPLRNTRKGSP
jgi:hypothetical protein